ncbi:CaiB/BaiF CoA transferase family protein [Psychrobacillus soli]|uniref:CoA transferase n=1 Tax=Psychrobacillus soli TaxID=1543965 RepID=A0A544TDM0_9BACI|nr:CaiB/BaiF CoA-transferase family protein [Psychrobacillus soli]TQR15531.1 CoA transferase [Psychrobacillus soli]
MLKSVKVLSFTHFLQGPAAVQFLGDLGADVIKIEHPRGAYERHWSGLNAFLNEESIFYLLAGRNQRSLSINLQTEEGKEIIYKMVKEADVLVENFRPGVMDRLGFGYEELKKINPSLVYCSCSGFGSTGPYKDRPGQDLLLQAMSGLASLNGKKKDAPVLVGSAIIDQHAATLAAMGILAALYERKETGKGKKVESNLLSAALDLQIEPFNYYLNGFPLYERSESGISSRFHQAPYGVFETSDDYLCLSLTNTAKLAAVFENDEFLQWSYEDQFDEREAINTKVAEHIKRNTKQFWFDKFDAHQIWYSPVNNYEDIEKDPQVEWNKNILEFDHPTAGKVRLLSHPVRYDGQAPKVRKVPPKLGEQTEEVLKEAGFNDKEIANLIDKGVVTKSQEVVSKS